jgi:hypothetical protein
MSAPVVRLMIELPEAYAWAFAQFLKRAGVSDYRRLAENEAEGYAMFYAAEAVREALMQAGCMPR